MIVSAELKASSEANRVRRKEEAEMEVGDVNIRDLLQKWVESSKREDMRNSLKVRLLRIFLLLPDLCRKVVPLFDKIPSAFKLPPPNTMLSKNSLRQN